MSENIRSFCDLRVFQNAFEGAMEIFNLSKRFPSEEKYSLTDQIRRSSRSVCSNIGEAWRKRRYKAAFVAKISDTEGEACETQVWLLFCLECQYLDNTTVARLLDVYEKVLAQLTKMVDGADLWIVRSSASSSSRPVSLSVTPPNSFDPSTSSRRRVAASPRQEV
jgi:four helix bundle protein